MKALSIIAAILVVLSLTFVYMLNDRDRSMWLLNSAVKLANPHPVLADISYGDKEWQKLDVYPSQNPDAAPVVIFIHGGSWRHGRKDQYRFLRMRLFEKGIPLSCQIT